MPSNVNVPNSIVTFPDNYDGTTPVPMMFGFHGAGRTNQEFHDVDARTGGSAMEDNFVMVYIKAAGSGWARSDVSRLDEAYNQITQNHCVDLNRVFATGHSSGAFFIEMLLCDGETRFSAVAPVAGSRVCDGWDNPIPTLLIHGLNDNQRIGEDDTDGSKERSQYLAANGCDMTSTQYSGAMACNSIHNQAAVDNGCVQYDGCSQTFVFCNHNDLNYGDTNHGWPCFANQTMYDFLSAL